MSRTHILAGEGNTGYTDLIGSPLISAVVETTKYSAVGTGTSLYLFKSHCINNDRTVNAPWHMTSLYRVEETWSKYI